MKSFRSFWALLVLIVLAAPVRAETWVGDSLEWMTDDSQLILRGKVIKVGSYPSAEEIRTALNGEIE